MAYKCIEECGITYYNQTERLFLAKQHQLESQMSVGCVWLSWSSIRSYVALAGWLSLHTEALIWRATFMQMMDVLEGRSEV